MHLVEATLGDLVMLEKACKRGTSDPNNGCEGDQVISFSTEGIEAGLPLHATLLFVLFDK